MTTNNYPGMPENYVVCFRNECPMAKTCLRNIVSQEPRKKLSSISVVNPYLVKDVTDRCEFYRSNVPVKVAYGIGHIFDYVPAIKHDMLYHSVKYYLGKHTYYNILHKERPIMPEEQEAIQRIFTNAGIQDPVKYEEYKEIINW